MARYKRVINAITGESKRIAFTLEEETLRDEQEAKAVINKQIRTDKDKLLHDEKAALQQKLGLADKEMEILGKVGRIK